MKKYIISFYILFSTSIYCLGQESIIVQGHLNAKDTNQISKNNADRFVLVKMTINNAVYQSTFIDKKGFFEFYKPCSSRNFKIEFYYLGYRMRPIIHISETKKNKLILNCQFNLNHFVDSIEKRKDFKFPNCISYSYCGNSEYSDFKLYKFSLKYGLRYENMGCSYFDEKVTNKEAIKKLNKSLGDNWEKVFMKEIESKLK